MSMYIGNGRVALVEYRHGGLGMDAFASRIDLVLAVINNGGIGAGDDTYYGSPAHLAALDMVERQIAVTRKLIAEQAEREASALADGSDES